MMRSKMTRRGFVCGCSAAIAAMAGSRFNSLVFGAPGSTDQTLVVVFLRGGMDGMSLIPPIGGSDHGIYVGARPHIAVPTVGTNAALNLGGGFGLHPAAAPLHSIYQSGHLAVVHATGLTTEATRSHFDAQAYMELGTPGSTSTHTGWLTRYLQTASLPPSLVMPSLSIGSLQHTSLRGDLDAVNMESLNSFNLDEGPWQWQTAHRTSLRRLYQNGTTTNHQAGQQALDALDVIELGVSGGYSPAGGSAPLYDDAGSFGSHLKTVAQMVKLELGLQVATLDLGGWDTHENQGSDGGGYFANLVGDLASGLAAFHTDLAAGPVNDYSRRVTLVVQSEFGRRLFENANRGLDHGHGNTMLVLGGKVNGGLHGFWPGLGDLFDGNDLQVTTDFRRVLSEILIRRMGNNRLDLIFPGTWAAQYQSLGPLGVVQGTDLPVVLGPEIFQDAFESGTTEAWGSSLG